MHRRRPFHSLGPLLLVALRAAAHPVSQVAVDAEILDDRLRVAVEVKAEDLVWFHLPAATNQPVIAAQALRRAAQNHARLLLDGLVLIDDRGNRLPGQPNGSDQTDLAKDVPAAELKSRIVDYRFTFPLTRPTAFLTVAQTIGGNDPPVPCTLDLTLRRAGGALLGKPVNLSAGIPHTIEIDQRPPPASLAEIRRQKEERFQHRLGIPDLNALHSFIHIEPAGIRHELIVPHHELTRWLPTVKPASSLDPADWTPALTAFLHTNSSAEIDGIDTPAVLKQVRFLNPLAIDFGDKAGTRPATPLQARAAITIRHPSSTPARHIRLRWSVFTRQVPFIKSIVLAPDQPPRHSYLTAQRPVFEWRAPDETDRSPLEKLQLEIADRLHVPPAPFLLEKLRPNTDTDVIAGRVIEITPTRARWRWTTHANHWGHRHEEERAFIAALTVKNRRLTDFRIVGQQLLRSAATPVRVQEKNILRTR